MKRAAIVLALTCGLAHASEPGQWLDCSDMVVLVPGITCAEEPDPIPNTGVQVGITDAYTIDNDGFLYVGGTVPSPTSPCLPYPKRFEVRRSRNGLEELVAYIDHRCSPGGDDLIEVGGGEPLGPLFEPLTGVFRLSLGSESAAGYRRWTLKLQGFTPLFEVQQTYQTSIEAFSFRVPVRPNDLPAVDHFDSYYGPLVKPIDFSQAQPLQCDYPAFPPAQGSILSFADVVPDPAPGQGVYYLTAASNEVETRAGRRRSGSVLMGRDVSQLPGCDR